MSFMEAVMVQPPLVRYWVFWLAFITTISWIVLLLSRQTRRDGLILFLASVAVTVWMQWLYATEGFVRLLGLPHVVLWTPLLIYFVYRVRTVRYETPFRQIVYALMASIAVSLIFDYIDVARYLLGNREPLAPHA
ncbi:MAG: hypothetical protein RIM72_19860 [Alphaproteobacteria bacterium]